MGTAILRRYVILGPIGRGGVSVVYQAIDTQSARPRALKLVAPAFAGDPGAWDRVRREAEITARLRHPSVPRIYDCGDAPLPDGSTVPYVVMELLTGVVLAGRLVGGALPWHEAVSTAATIADVLAVAHRRGVVHRDLAPENIMLTRAGVKIIDFGLAATLDGSSPCRSAPAGVPADDVYALGVLLYQMLTGRSPYPEADPDLALSASRWRGVAPTPVLVVPGMPREIADICRDCMAKRPADRPDASSVAIALLAVLMPVTDVEPLFHPADR